MGLSGGLNVYAYVYARVLFLSDPTGKVFTHLGLGLFGGVVGSISNIISGILCGESPKDIAWGTLKGFGGGFVSGLFPFGFGKFASAAVGLAANLVGGYIAGAVDSNISSLLDIKQDIRNLDKHKVMPIRWYPKNSLVGSISGGVFGVAGGVATCMPSYTEGC